MEKVIKEPNRDPRPDLKKDSYLWKAVLSLMYKRHSSDTPLYWFFSNIRTHGTMLSFSGKSLTLDFPPDYDEGWKSYIRQRYILPFKAEIEGIFTKVALKYKKCSYAYD